MTCPTLIYLITQILNIIVTMVVLWNQANTLLCFIYKLNRNRFWIGYFYLLLLLIKFVFLLNFWLLCIARTVGVRFVHKHNKYYVRRFHCDNVYPISKTKQLFMLEFYSYCNHVLTENIITLQNKTEDLNRVVTVIKAILFVTLLTYEEVLKSCQFNSVSKIWTNNSILEFVLKTFVWWKTSTPDKAPNINIPTALDVRVRLYDIYITCCRYINIYIHVFKTSWNVRLYYKH